MKRVCLAGFTLLILICSASAQDSRLKKIDEFVEAEMQRQKVPGVALAIVEDGKIAYAKGYGLANVEHRVPVRVETVFQSGSVGKQFTSAAVMLLVEDGRINPDDKITKYFADAPPSWEKITVRHLLTHTSGMTDYPENFDYRKDYTEAGLYRIIRETPLAFEPGEKWSYSNLGYVTLGILVRKVSGKFYGDFLRERVFGPLEMKTARVISEADIVPNRAAGYVLVKGELKNQEWVAPALNTTADGALYLTLDDMARWDAALYGEKLFKKTSLEQMWSPVKLNDGTTHPYGFGWALGKATGSKTIEHGGAWQGFMSFIARYPDARTTVIVFANLSRTDVHRMASGAAAIYDPKLAPIRAEAIEDKEPEVTEFAKNVLRKVIGGTLEKELFDTAAQEALYPRIAGLSEAVKSLGNVRKLELLERQEREEFRRYRYRAIFEGREFSFILVLNKQGKIRGMQLHPE
jgi:D-alanyl-D-alanine carboxypeptidase